MALTGSFTPDNLIAGDAKIVTEDVLIPAGNNLDRGTVLGRVKQSTPTTGTVVGTGNGTCTAVTGGAKTKQGTYKIQCRDAVAHGGVFDVYDPAGKNLGTVEILGGAGGTGVFKSDEINFTLTDGSTDFIVGDYINIVVTEGVPNTAACVGTGNGTLTNVEGRRDLKVGAYVLTCTAAVTHGGVFKLEDPDGNILKDDITIPPGAGNSINFETDDLAGTITDGSTDFAVADTFTVTVTIAPRQCKAADKAATDGSSEPYAVLLEALDATSAAKVGAAALAGEFNERALIFASGNDIEDFRDMMRDAGMFTKSSEPA